MIDWDAPFRSQPSPLALSPFRNWISDLRPNHPRPQLIIEVEASKADGRTFDGTAKTPAYVPTLGRGPPAKKHDGTWRVRYPKNSRRIDQTTAQQHSMAAENGRKTRPLHYVREFPSRTKLRPFLIAQTKQEEKQSRVR